MLVPGIIAVAVLCAVSICEDILLMEDPCDTSDCDPIFSSCSPSMSPDSKERYVCQCNDGFTGDGKKGSCSLVKTCPPANSSLCDANATCTPTIVDNEATYPCGCNKGFAGNGYVGQCKVINGTEITNGSLSKCAKKSCSVSNKDVCILGPVEVACGNTSIFTCGCGSVGTPTTLACDDGVIMGNLPKCFQKPVAPPSIKGLAE